MIWAESLEPSDFFVENILKTISSVNLKISHYYYYYYYYYYIIILWE